MSRNTPNDDKHRAKVNMISRALSLFAVFLAQQMKVLFFKNPLRVCPSSCELEGTKSAFLPPFSPRVWVCKKSHQFGGEEF